MLSDNSKRNRAAQTDRRAGIREIRTAVPLQSDQKALIERIDCFRRLIFELRRHVTKTKDRALDRATISKSSLACTSDSRLRAHARLSSIASLNRSRPTPFNSIHTFIARKRLDN